MHKQQVNSTSSCNSQYKGHYTHTQTHTNYIYFTPKKYPQKKKSPNYNIQLKFYIQGEFLLPLKINIQFDILFVAESA